ncbi:hypothetical protein LTR70_008539 [Exophiala xenobiotica]|uniref:Uncharacterized protein n=1 Tax=Lithohypha guttulata TaxID=1690604 RepID=A0ABR0K0U9_9EURO|nr:hypothetical protein LTR24_008167 [Lithohypha guttulata]KAK5311813.1 hypothetical protein LTR70_008539 [Exophiala xenobiotica]
MPSLLVTGTAQALVLGSISNILAQFITAQQGGRPFHFDLRTFAFFLTWTLVSCPPNILWQIYLEQTYPANKIDPRAQGVGQGKPQAGGPGRQRLSKTNTTKKFLLDQSIGATANTVGYIAALAAFRGRDSAGILGDVQKDFWPIMQAGWKVWPLVALLSFTVIPLEKRTLFGSSIGLFWGIYMSMLAAQ